MVVAMPEATMNENDFFTAAKYKIRTTCQIVSMEAIAKALGENQMTHKHLWP